MLSNSSESFIVIRIILKSEAQFMVNVLYMKKKNALINCKLKVDIFLFIYVWYKQIIILFSVNH